MKSCAPIPTLLVTLGFGCGGMQMGGHPPASETETAQGRALAPQDAERLRAYVSVAMKLLFSS